MNSVGVFSFFSGAGFLDLGFETEGFHTVFINEYHKPFLRAYLFSRERMGMHIVDNLPVCCDIKEFAAGKGRLVIKEAVKKANNKYDLIGFIGGPPCPDFSVGGKNRGQHGDNGRLSQCYVDLICDRKPDFFLFENVKGLISTERHRIFYMSLKKQLQDQGYLITDRLLNCFEYGAPQDRSRIIMIGFKKPRFNKQFDCDGNNILNFPWKKHAKYTVDQVLGMTWPTTSKFIEDSDLRMPSGIIEELTVEHWFRKNDVYNHPNSNQYFKPRAGLVKFKVISEGDTDKKSYKRLHRWRYSPTACYGNNEVHLHPYKARRLSVSEAMAIQSLPKKFVIPDDMTLSNMFKTIGNGVPYIAAKMIARTLKEVVDNAI